VSESALAADPRLEAARSAISATRRVTPTVGVVLGSGLGAFADSLDESSIVPYAEVPHLPRPGVAGHGGRLCFGNVGPVSVACLDGRVHLYEGYPANVVVFASRLLVALGCRTIIITNAAGGIRAGLLPGSLMLITDHLNLTGENPLVGQAGAFIDMTQAYDPALCGLARRAAREIGVDLEEGVYAGLRGPSYETPAEIRMLKVLGADAVGMSTVLEVIALRHAGARVAAVSNVTNLAAGLSETPLSHREVQETAHHSRDRFVSFLTRWVLLSSDLDVEDRR
jgi:purine-nucleoside phosphorylase